MAALIPLVQIAIVIVGGIQAGLSGVVTGLLFGFLFLWGAASVIGALPKEAGHDAKSVQNRIAGAVGAVGSLIAISVGGWGGWVEVASGGDASAAFAKAAIVFLGEER